MLNINWNLFVVREIFPYVCPVCRLGVEEATGDEYVLQNTYWKDASCYTAAIKLCCHVVIYVTSLKCWGYNFVLAVYCLGNIYRHVSKLYAVREDFCAAGNIVWTAHIWNFKQIKGITQGFPLWLTTLYLGSQAVQQLVIRHRCAPIYVWSNVLFLCWPLPSWEPQYFSLFCN